jgi:SAM-dependent methyltransferase
VPDLEILHDERGAREVLATAIQDLADGSRPLRVLEAGCGQKWAIDLKEVPLHITGVDTDAEAMRIRRARTKDLDVEIIGDLRTVELPSAQFDVVYCSYVLEHVAGAEGVMDRLVEATRHGGRLIIRIPDGKTVYGFLVRRSPHFVHVWYKRYIEGFKDAGKPGHAPYPTVYDPIVSLQGMTSYVEQHGLRLVRAYGSDSYLKVFRKAAPLVEWLIRAVSVLSRGRLAASHSDLGIVIERP